MGLTQAIKSIKLKTQEGNCVVMRDQKLLAATAYCNRKSIGTSSVEIRTSECRAFTSETQSASTNLSFITCADPALGALGKTFLQW